MSTALRLSNLPKSKAGAIKSVKVSDVSLFTQERIPYFHLQFRRTTPGGTSHILYPESTPTGQVLDPTHPLARSNPRLYNGTLPKFFSKELIVRAVPKALLSRPELIYPHPPFDYAPYPSQPRKGNERGGLEGKKLGRSKGKRDDVVHMSLLHIIPKKLHKSAFVRLTVKSRLKTAVSLVITRGACAERSADGKGKQVLVSRDEDSRSWVLSGAFFKNSSLSRHTDQLVDWTYVFFPTLHVYRMPYIELITLIRKGLTTINDSAKFLSQKWRKSGWSGTNLERLALLPVDDRAKGSRYFWAGTHWVRREPIERNEPRDQTGGSDELDDEFIRYIEPEPEPLDASIYNPISYLLNTKTLKSLDSEVSVESALHDLIQAKLGSQVCWR